MVIFRLVEFYGLILSKILPPCFRINRKGFSKKDIYELLDDMNLIQQFFVSLHEQTYLKVSNLVLRSMFTNSPFLSYNLFIIRVT